VETGGTGISAGLEHYTVAGKTGTAEIPLPGGRGYMSGKNLHSFMGFLPASQPEVCISVVLEQPEHGRYASQTAAPSFQRIAEYITRYLKIRPDRTLTIFETEQAISEAQLAINPSLEP
jgi:cell division protein FtsI/penicillin-binding protein 2